ncbi:MAG: AAA family ATPase, partial [Acidocella sp.]|nr:AAA family ATPase [Acidocella sp.]
LGAAVEFPDLATRDGQEEVMAKVRQMGADLVILDNFSTLAEVADENEAAAMNPILSFLMRLKQANVACILVHHSGKSGDTYRGSSKLATTFEVILGLRQLSGLAGEGGAAFELRWEKFRGRRTAATRDAEMKLLTEADERQRWETKPAASSEMLAVVDAVRSCQYTHDQDVGKALGLSKVEVSRHKARATTTGVISREEWRACLEAAREDKAPDNTDF